jgi:hypothetical protein
MSEEKYDLNGKIPLDKLMSSSSDFMAFPSIHGDILQNLNIHSSDELLTPTYVFGLGHIRFSDPVISSSRLLALAVRRMIGSREVLLSEISAPFATGIVGLTDGLDLLNQLYFLPIDVLADITVVLDALGIFVAEYVLAQRLPMPSRRVIVQHLKELAETFGSRALEGRGALESMISRIEAQTNDIDNTEDDETGKSDEIEASEAHAPAGTPEVALKRICEELRRITRLPLVLGDKKEYESEQFTRVEVVFKYPQGGVPAGSASTPRLTTAIEDYGRLLAADRVYRSVKYRPFVFQDGIMLVIKINWIEYPNEETIGLWSREA